MDNSKILKYEFMKMLIKLFSFCLGWCVQTNVTKHYKFTTKGTLANTKRNQMLTVYILGKYTIYLNSIYLLKTVKK